MDNKNQMGINLKTLQVKTQIKNILEKSGLPLSLIYFMVHDIDNELKNLYDTACDREYSDFCNQQKKEETEEEN